MTDDDRPDDPAPRLGALLDLRTTVTGDTNAFGRRLPLRPSWASRSVAEDGGVTHEHLSRTHPMALRHRSDVGTVFAVPTDVSVSVVDRAGQHRWIRQPPIIQVEGGSYPLAQAYLLVRAVEELIALVR
jgi:hypothetical protein